MKAYGVHLQLILVSRPSPLIPKIEGDSQDAHHPRNFLIETNLVKIQSAGLKLTLVGSIM